MKKINTHLQFMVKAGLCLYLLTSLAACAGEVGDTAVNDPEIVAGTETAGATQDDGWDSDEFNTRFASTNYYEEWDENDDNLLDDNEFMGGFFDTWDANDDNQLDENEFTTASNDWGLENESWADWDTSGDGILDENEFNTGFADNGWFDDWDADNDNMLAEREYTDGVFGVWDENDDSLLDTNEYGLYDTYYGV